MERGTVTLILRYARVPEKPTAGSPEKEENSQLGTHHGFRVQPFILGKCTRYPETNGWLKAPENGMVGREYGILVDPFGN